MAKYGPLKAFLLSRPYGRVTLSFREIEDILATTLPPSARKHDEWWANTDSHIQARTWMDAGWRTEGLSIGREIVTFSRGSGESRSRPKPKGAESGKAPSGQDATLVISVPLNLLRPKLLEVLQAEARDGGRDLGGVVADRLNRQEAEEQIAVLRRFRARFPTRSDGADPIQEEGDGDAAARRSRETARQR